MAMAQMGGGGAPGVGVGAPPPFAFVAKNAPVSWDAVLSFDVETFEHVARVKVANGRIMKMSCASDLLFLVHEFFGPGSLNLYTSQTEIVVLDSRTLAERRRFGASVFAGGSGAPFRGSLSSLALAVVGKELYVAGASHHGHMHVFSFAGEHLRDITGGWRQVDTVLHHYGRLYVSEYAGRGEEPVANEPDIDEEDEDTWPEEKKQAGKRILVLTPRGDTLQVWKPPRPEGHHVDRIAFVKNMAIFGRKLVVDICYDCVDGEDGAEIESAEWRLLALKGI